MTELIIALDMDAPGAGVVFSRLHRELGQRWFKIGARLLLDYSGRILIEHMLRDDALIFLDLKLYDTRDTVAATARRAFALGARFLTVHATPSMLEAAITAKTDERQKVLAVDQLSDANTSLARLVRMIGIPADGIICPADLVGAVRNEYTKTIVVPGIRPPDAPRNNHMWVATPREAKNRGADYVVVGRPIISARDPIAAARAIMEELR